MNTVDTIAAIATGTGGAIGIVRISGPDALKVANRVWRGKTPLSRVHARQMRLGRIGEPGEPALAVYMPGPASYTGDDIVELHCHGGLVAVRRTLDAVLASGARSAEPGEFTMRAFVSGKMDLTRAEAVGDLIGARSDSAFKLAARQLSGRLSGAIANVRGQLLELLSDCESRLDFPDEKLDWTPPATLTEKLYWTLSEIHNLRESHHEGAILRDGVRVVLAGRPNAGKSSLLNLLLGLDRAIVSAIPGTTRDTLEECAVLRRIPVHLTDTAGLREAHDEIETIGVARALQSLDTAQVVFWLLDSAAEDLEAEVAEFNTHAPRHPGVIAIWNKLDLTRGWQLPKLSSGVPVVRLSAATGENLDALLDEFEKQIWNYPHEDEPELAVNARHEALLSEAAGALEPVAAELEKQRWELAAVGLREALVALGKIIGEGADPDVLEEIFARFCIGK